MASTYNLISIITFILAAIFFLLSVFMFFKFNIIKISGDLSGRNARKSIDAMKNSVSTVPAENRAVYDAVVNQQPQDVHSVRTITTDMSYDQGNVTAELTENINSTTLLSEEQLGTNVAGTTVLGANEIGTTVLSAEQLIPESKRFIVVKEITFVHTN